MAINEKAVECFNDSNKAVWRRKAEHETNFELVWLHVKTLSVLGECLHKLRRKSFRLAFNLISFHSIRFLVSEVSQLRSCRSESRKLFFSSIFDTSAHPSSWHVASRPKAKFAM